MKTLVIDDLRKVVPAFEPVTYARTPNEGIIRLTDETWELVCLDHDLGFNFTEGELTIWPCIEFIEQNAASFRKTIFYIITSNPWGAQRMAAALNAAGLTNYIISEAEKRNYFTA
jgi:hypothetical protein